jgi:hypothetical protein
LQNFLLNEIGRENVRDSIDTTSMHFPNREEINYENNFIENILDGNGVMQASIISPNLIRLEFSKIFCQNLEVVLQESREYRV